MALKKKFISCKTQANFEELLEEGEISDYSIVYILDTKNIWTHGTYFAGAEALKDILVAGENIEITTEDGLVTISSYDTEYTIDIDPNTRVFTMTDKEGNVQSVVLSDTRNTAGIILDDSNPLYLIGANKDTVNDIDLGIINVLGTYTGTSDLETGTTIEETDDGLELTYTQEEDGKFAFTYLEQGWDITNYINLNITYTSELDSSNTITVTIVDNEDNEYSITSSPNSGTITMDLTKVGEDFNSQNVQQIIIQLAEPGVITLDSIEMDMDGNYNSDGTIEGTDFVQTNRSSAYTQNGNVYDKNGKKLINKTELDDAITNALATAGIQYDFVVCGRVTGDADPSFSYYYGNQEDLSNILSHLRLSVVRGQDDYTYLNSTRVTQSETGEAISLDGSDGDLMVATDTTIYFYSEIATDGDGNTLELCGIGLTPFSLFGVDAVEMPPFAFSMETVSCQLTSENTDHITKDDAVEMLHSIYNPNILGTADSSNSTAIDYKPDASGYRTVNITSSKAGMLAQAHNESNTVCYPYASLYYRFVEVWLSALYCEIGTRDLHTLDLFGAGDCSISEYYVNANNFYDEAQSASCGYCRVAKSNNAHTFYNTDNTAFSQNVYMKTPMHLGLRVIDAITKQGNLSYINNYKYTFDIDGNVYNNIDLYNGSNMVSGKSFFQVREVPGLRGFSEGVMTGVVLQYVMVENDANYRYIMKNPIPLYRGLNICPGQLISTFGFFQGCRNYYFQRDPMKLNPYTSTSMNVASTSSALISGFDSYYWSSADTNGYGQKINPSISMYACVTKQSNYSTGGNLHTYLANHFRFSPGSSATKHLEATMICGASNEGSAGRGCVGFGRSFVIGDDVNNDNVLNVAHGMCIIHLNSKDKPE